MENDGYGGRGAGANLNTDDDVTITFLPLVDSERKLLHVHFLSAQEVSSMCLLLIVFSNVPGGDPQCPSSVALSVLLVMFLLVVIIATCCNYWSDYEIYPFQNYHVEL